MSASPSSSPRHRGSIERGVDGGDHRVIGGRAGEMGGDRPQEMIAFFTTSRRARPPPSLRLGCADWRERAAGRFTCIIRIELPDLRKSSELTTRSDGLIRR
jgi:hypothetical protein